MLKLYREGKVAHPSNYVTMLQECKPWQQLKSTSQAQVFLDCIPKVTRQFVEIGYCHENEFDVIFDEAGAVDATIRRPPHLKHFNEDMAVNRGNKNHFICFKIINTTLLPESEVLVALVFSVS